MKNKKRISKGIIKLIVGLSVAVFVILSLIITNIFIPVKYLGAYVIFKKDENPRGTMRIRYLNVGFGDSTLVEFPDGKTLLIDGGVGTYSNVHMLLKLLNSSGIDKIDYLVCTSIKSEHCGSFAELIKYKSVGTAFIPYVTNDNVTDEYSSFKSQLYAKGVKTEAAEYGKGVYNPEYGYNFFFLSPNVIDSAESEYNPMNANPTNANINAASIVLWLQYSDNGFLFLSDADGAVQSKIASSLVAENKKYYFDGMEFTYSQCAVLKAANHCGKNSSQAALYDVLSPNAAVISVGQNGMNCPSSEDISVLQLYVGEKIFRTDLHGTLTVYVSEGQYSIYKEF